MSNWNDAAAVKTLVARGEAKALAASFDAQNETHQQTWLALLPQERVQILSGPTGAAAQTMANALHVVACAWMQATRKADAITVFDDLVTFPKLQRSIYNNALWAIMDDNSKLGVMPERAQRYLQACLPHGPENPAIFYNAACICFELGDRAATVRYAQQAKEHDYDLENIRDEKMLQPMATDPAHGVAWNALFAALDPPQVTSMDEALKDPLAVRNLEPNVKGALPDLTVFQNLEVLDLAMSGLKELPANIAQLPKLRKLQLAWNPLKKIPEEILAMPSLEEVTLWDTGLPKAYQANAINAMLLGHKKSNAPHATRLLHIALLVGTDAAVKQQASVRSLVEALDSNVGKIRARALSILEAMVKPPPVLSAGATIGVAGTLHMDKEMLKERLAAASLRAVKKPNEKGAGVPVLVVVGEKHGGKALPFVDAGVPVVLELQLKALLDAHGKPHLEAATGADAVTNANEIADLLTSDDKGSVQLALTMMSRGGAPAGVLEELLIVMQDVDADKKARAQAKSLFAQTASRATQDTLVKVLGGKSMFLSGETKLGTRLRALEKGSKGELNGVKLALRLLPESGLRFLFSVAQKDPARADVAHTAIRSRIKGDALDLGGLELDALPAQLVDYPALRTLSVGGNHLTSLPDFLARMPGLRALDFSHNRLNSVASTLPLLKNIEELDLGTNFLKVFPEEIFALPHLRVLNLYTERYGREIPFTSLPDGFAALPLLEELNLSAHKLKTLPPSMQALTKLKKLDLGSGALGTLPAWVGDLPALELLDVEYADIDDKPAVRKVAEAIRARGGTVVGLK